MKCQRIGFLCIFSWKAHLFAAAAFIKWVERKSKKTWIPIFAQTQAMQCHCDCDCICSMQKWAPEAHSLHLAYFAPHMNTPPDPCLNKHQRRIDSKFIIARVRNKRIPYRILSHRKMYTLQSYFHQNCFGASSHRCILCALSVCLREFLWKLYMSLCLRLKWHRIATFHAHDGSGRARDQRKRELVHYTFYMCYSQDSNGKIEVWKKGNARRKYHTRCENERVTRWSSCDVRYIKSAYRKENTPNEPTKKKPERRRRRKGTHTTTKNRIKWMRVESLNRVALCDWFLHSAAAQHHRIRN